MLAPAPISCGHMVGADGATFPYRSFIPVRESRRAIGARSVGARSRARPLPKKRWSDGSEMANDSLENAD